MNGLESIRGQGRRLTPQRQLVYAALQESPGHATADELCARVSVKVPGFQRTTVYRTLDLLVQIGLARKLQLGQANVYEVVEAGDESHQHLVCDSCGGAFDVSAAEVATWVEREARKLDFELARVDLVGHGTCTACQPSPRLPAAN